MVKEKETNQEAQDTNVEAANTEATNAESTNTDAATTEATSVAKMDTLPASLQEQVAKTERRTVKKLVEETLKGAYGTGRERMILLGDKYEKVQYEINQMIKKGEVE